MKWWLEQWIDELIKAKLTLNRWFEVESQVDIELRIEVMIWGWHGIDDLNKQLIYDYIEVTDIALKAHLIEDFIEAFAEIAFWKYCLVINNCVNDKWR